jgi:hypothetical protein
MAAGRLHAGRDYGWRGARRIILRSGDIAVRNAPAAGRWVRMCAFVTSDGIGGTDGFGGAVPLCAFVTSDGIGGTDGFGATGALGDGHSRVVAGPSRVNPNWPRRATAKGPDPGAVRLVRAWRLPLARGAPPQRPRRPLA